LSEVVPMSEPNAANQLQSADSEVQGLIAQLEEQLLEKERGGAPCRIPRSATDGSLNQPGTAS
jgi:hypothetical protein